MGYASKDTRERAVAAYKTGEYTQQEVAKMFGVHYKTIANWLKFDALGLEQKPLERGHPKRILNDYDLQVIALKLEAEPSATINDLMECTGKICSQSVYSRALSELGLSHKKKT